LLLTLDLLACIPDFSKFPPRMSLDVRRTCTIEIRALRTLSRRTAHATRILHHGALELTHPSGDLLALLSDASEFGTLDRFTAMQVRYTVSQTSTYRQIAL
jgi:hypothetical protein